jgi:acetyl esterase/lipase
MSALATGCSGVAHESAPAGGPDEPVESTAVVRDCPAAAPAATSVGVEHDVVYSAVGGETLRLDVAWPKDAGPRPLVVLLHGGGWSGGSRVSLHGEMTRLAAHGYVAAAVDYRLTSSARNAFPAAVQDVRCAIRWLRAHAATYAIDPALVAAAGYSAGGHLAGMLATASDVTGLDGACDADARSAAVAAAISYAGPHDLRVRGPYTDEQASIVTNFLGVFPGDDPELAALASPITHVGPGDAPMLLVHGTADALVPVEQSRRMREALRDAGVPATVVELRGVRHAFVGLATSERPAVRCTVLTFLDRWLSRAD